MPRFRSMPHPRVLSTLLAIAVVVSWLAVSLVHTGRLVLVVHNQALIAYGGATAATLASGEWWRIVTSQFIHVYLPHALLNATAVLLVGSQIERLFGAARLALVSFFAGTCGQLVAVAIAPTTVATGASQAATGLCAAGIAAYLARAEARRRELVAPIAYLGMQVALDLLFAGRIKLPHLVSFGAGLAAGGLCLWRQRVVAG